MSTHRLRTGCAAAQPTFHLDSENALRALTVTRSVVPIPRRPAVLAAAAALASLAAIWVWRDRTRLHRNTSRR